MCTDSVIPSTCLHSTCELQVGSMTVPRRSWPWHPSLELPTRRCEVSSTCSGTAPPLGTSKPWSRAASAQSSDRGLETCPSVVAWNQSSRTMRTSESNWKTNHVFDFLRHPYRKHWDFTLTCLRKDPILSFTTKENIFSRIPYIQKFQLYSHSYQYLSQSA